MAPRTLSLHEFVESGRTKVLIVAVLTGETSVSGVWSSVGKQDLDDGKFGLLTPDFGKKCLISTLQTLSAIPDLDP